MLNGKKRILVLEDDASVQRLLARSLSERGFEVEARGDGLQGLMALESFVPDLVIADIMMPNLDGLEFLQAIKGHDRTRGVPVIILSARDDSKTMIEGIRAGARHYVTKPFELPDLISKVEKALRR